MLGAFFIVKYSITVVSVILNSFLIFCALRVQPRHSDVKLIIALASTEYLVALVLFSDAIYYGATGFRLIHDTLGCQINGAIITLTYYCEIYFNIMLVIDRISKIAQKDLPYYFFYPLHFNTLLFVSLVVAISATNSMVPTASDLICDVSPMVSVFSEVIYYYIFLSLISGVLTISFCYYKIASIINTLSNFVDLELGSKKDKVKSPSKYKTVTKRIYIMLVIYATFMLSSGIFHVAGNSLELVRGKIDSTSILLSQLSQIFFISGIVANSTILLFLHTGIATEVKKILKTVFKKY